MFLSLSLLICLIEIYKMEFSVVFLPISEGGK